jgi:hypothetical protein
MKILISMLAILTLINSQTLSQPYYYQTKSTGPNDAKIDRFNLRTQEWEVFVTDHPRGLETVADPTQTWVFAKYRGGMAILHASDTSRQFDFSPASDVLGVVFVPQVNRFYITWNPTDDTSTMSAVYDATTFTPIDTLFGLSGVEFYFSNVVTAVSSDGSYIYNMAYNHSTGYQEIAKFSTQTNTVAELIELEHLGPPTDAKGVDAMMRDLALIGYYYPSPSLPDNHFVALDFSTNSLLVPISFPWRSYGHLSPSSEYVILERVDLNEQGEYRPGNISIYESRTGRLLRNLQLPPGGRILLFDNHADTLYYYIPASDSVVYVDFRDLHNPTNEVKGGVFLPNGGPVISVKAKPSVVFTTADTLIHAVATLRWPSDRNIVLGSVSSPVYGFAKLETVVTQGNYKYQKFRTIQHTALSWQAGQEYELFTVPLQNQVGFEEIEVSNALAGGEWFVDVNYVDRSDSVPYHPVAHGFVYQNKSSSPDATATNNARHLARTPTQEAGVYDLHEVFVSGGEVYYRRSPDDGSTWNQTHRLAWPRITRRFLVRSGYKRMGNGVEGQSKTAVRG